MTESHLQQMCVRWYDMQFRGAELRLFSIPNEGKRNPVNGAKMKAMGRRKGAPDMIFLMTGTCAFIEFKTDKGRQSPEQKQFQEVIAEHQMQYHIIRNFDEFKNLIVNLYFK